MRTRLMTTRPLSIRTTASWVLLVLVTLCFAYAVTTPSADALLEPSDPTGTGCQECGDKIYYLGDEVVILENTCIAADFAAALSGRTCTSGGGVCYIQDWCQYA